MIPTATASIALTVAFYVLSLQLRRRWQNAATTPVLITVAGVVAFLLLLHVPYAFYQPGGAIIVSGLGPATTALAVLTFKNRAVLFEHAGAVLAALTCGTIASTLCALAVARTLGLTHPFTGILALKSVTGAVSAQLAPVAHAPPALLAIVVIAVGMTGAVLGPSVLTLCAVRDRRSRGLALGTIAHSIGTAQAVTESETTGTASSLAMCLVALAMCSIGLPLVFLLGQ